MQVNQDRPKGNLHHLNPAAAIAAKKALAEKLEKIAALYLPAGWTVSYRKSLSGRCHHSEKRLAAPRPITRNALFIFLHECGHAHLHDDAAGRRMDGKRKPTHVVEYEAEMWAHAAMREHGIPVPKKMTERGKAYVAWKIKQALARGAKTIDADAATYARVVNNHALDGKLRHQSIAS